MGLDLPLQDDPSIPDQEQLYRAIHPLHMMDDGISSAAFNCGREHVSVDRSSLSTPSETLQRLQNCKGVAQITTGRVRKVTRIGVASDPKDDNPAHALIIRDPSMSHGAWKKAARALAKSCTWALPPQ